MERERERAFERRPLICAKLITHPYEGAVHTNALYDGVIIAMHTAT